MADKAKYLKKKIVEKNTTQEALAMALGIDRSTLYRKMKGGLSCLTLSEAKKISKYLGLSETEAFNVFFGQ